MSKHTDFDDSFDYDSYDEYEEYDVNPSKVRCGGGGSNHGIYSGKGVRAKEAMMEKAKTRNTVKTETVKKETVKKK